MAETRPHFAEDIYVVFGMLEVCTITPKAYSKALFFLLKHQGVFDDETAGDDKNLLFPP